MECISLFYRKMKENSVTASITVEQATEIPAETDNSVGGGHEYLCVMKTATCGTAPGSSTAANGGTASPARPIGADIHSVADPAHGAPALRLSDYFDDNTRQRKSSSSPPYFSRAYYRQLLLSFSSRKWFCPPPELSPFLLARNGFKCIDTGTIECVVCGAKWTAQKGIHSEILGTLTHTEHADAAGDTTALSLLFPVKSRTTPTYPIAISVVEASAREPEPRAAEDEGGTGPETQTAGVYAATLPAMDRAATPGAAAAAVGTINTYLETARREECKDQAGRYCKDKHNDHPGIGCQHVVKGVLEQQKQTAGSTGTDIALAHQFQQKKGRKTASQLLQDEKEAEKNARRRRITVSMDAVALSFLHAECCSWRNVFIPLTTIHLEGTAVQPAALISQWMKRVQHLRKVRATSSHSARYPRLALEGAHACLLGVLIAAAEATAAAHVKATTLSGVTALQGQGAAKYITSITPAEQHATDPEGHLKVASAVPVSKIASAVGKLEATYTLEETFCCSGESCVTQFLSSPQSPLQDACVSQLSKRETELLQQLWLFLARADGEREILVSKYIPCGTVVPPVSTSSLLLEKKYELGTGQKTDKQAGELLSLPVLETLLRQVMSFLFDTRVPLPGCFRSEVPNSPFVFPKSHESVHVQCDKLLAFFGWEPVTRCTISEEALHNAAAAAASRHQAQPHVDTPLAESGLLYAASQQSMRHEIERPDTPHHAETLLEHGERQGSQQQQDQLSRSRRVGDASRDEEESKVAPISAAELTAQGLNSLTALQCPYCFRYVELQKYAASEEDSCVISDSMCSLPSSQTAPGSQNGDETGAPRKSVEGRQQPLQERGGREARAAGDRNKRNGVETGEEQSAGSRSEGTLEDAARPVEEKHISENVVDQTGGTAGVMPSDGRLDRGCGSFSSRRCTSSNADSEVQVRQNRDGELVKEDALGGRVCTHQVHTQTDAITNTGGIGSISKERLVTSATATAAFFDPVRAHRLYCPFVSNAVYKDKLPIVLKLFLSLIPALVETVRLQAEKRRLNVEIDELLGSRKRLQSSKQRDNDEKEFRSNSQSGRP